MKKSVTWVRRSHIPSALRVDDKHDYIEFKYT